MAFFVDLQDAWIGASDRANEGTFRWAAGPEAGQVVDRINEMWAPGEPSNEQSDDCVVILEHKLFDQYCAESHGYLIEYEGVILTGHVCRV